MVKPTDGPVPSVIWPARSIASMASLTQAAAAFRTTISEGAAFGENGIAAKVLWDVAGINI